MRVVLAGCRRASPIRSTICLANSGRGARPSALERRRHPAHRTARWLVARLVAGGDRRPPHRLVAVRAPLARHRRRPAWPVPRQVDYRLVGSAIARVRWELDGRRVAPRSAVLHPAGARPGLRSAAAAAAVHRRARRCRSLPVWPTPPRMLEQRTHQPGRRAAALRQARPGDPRGHRGAGGHVSRRNWTPCCRHRIAGGWPRPRPPRRGALGAYRAWLQGRVADDAGDHRRRSRAVHALPARGGDGAVHAGRTAGDGPAGVGARRRVRSAGTAAAIAPCRRCRIFPDQAAQVAKSANDEAAIRAFLERERAADGPGVDAALPEPAVAGVSGAARRSSASPTISPARRASRRRLQLHPRAVGDSAVLLPVHRARPAADHRPRGRARSLPAAGAVVGARESDPRAATTTPARTKASASMPKR